MFNINKVYYAFTNDTHTDGINIFDQPLKFYTKSSIAKNICWNTQHPFAYITQVLIPSDANVTSIWIHSWKSDKLLLTIKYPLYSADTIAKFNLHKSPYYINYVIKLGYNEILDYLQTKIDLTRSPINITDNAYQWFKQHIIKKPTTLICWEDLTDLIADATRKNLIFQWLSETLNGNSILEIDQLINHLIKHSQIYILNLLFTSQQINITYNQLSTITRSPLLTKWFLTFLTTTGLTKIDKNNSLFNWIVTSFNQSDFIQIDDSCYLTKDKLINKMCQTLDIKICEQIYKTIPFQLTDYNIIDIMTYGDSKILKWFASKKNIGIIYKDIFNDHILFFEDSKLLFE
jgi:hypothetical protein